MEEKINFERPRPFSSGFLIPFHQLKKPIELVVQTSKIEVFPKTLAIYISPETNLHQQIEELDTFAVELLQKNNNQWFKNDLTKDAIREKYSRTLSSDNYIQLKCSSSHPPKKVYLDDVLQEDWTRMMKLLDRSSDTIDTIYITLICHGIYVQRKGFSLLWKIPNVNAYSLTDISNDTEIEECKKEIEQFWLNEIKSYDQQVHQEIALLEKTILAKKERVKHYLDVLMGCQKYMSSEPEWNTSIEYIKQQLFKYRTPTVS